MSRRTTWYIIAAVAVVLAGWWLWAWAHRPTYPEINSPRPVKGSATATIKLEEFSDFQCPACKAAQPLLKEVLATFGDRVSLTFKHFPLVSVHTQAFRAALASECANDQGKFWEYHDALFDNQPNFSRADLITYAQQLQLRIDGDDGFAACLDARAKTKVVRQDMSEGDKRGIDSTPTFFLNGQRLQDWSKLKELIQAKLAGG